MPKLKAGHISPAPQENAAINAGIAADDDARELDDAWFAKAKPASEAFAPVVRYLHRHCKSLVLC